MKTLSLRTPATVDLEDDFADKMYEATGGRATVAHINGALCIDVDFTNEEYAATDITRFMWALRDAVLDSGYTAQVHFHQTEENDE